MLTSCYLSLIWPFLAQYPERAFLARSFMARKITKACAKLCDINCISVFLLLAICYILIFLKGEALISLFLTDTDASGNIALTLQEGQKYLRVMLIGLVPFIISQCYSSTLRESGETMLPMKAGIIAVFVNLVFNYILIFGNFGAPALGVEGAAIATVISRFVETGVIVVVAHRRQDQYRFLTGLYSSPKISWQLVKRITMKGTPLMLNELLWSLGLSTIMQSYSLRGLSAIAALNINSTVFNLFNTVYMALGNSISIIVGQQLGAGEREKARDTDYKLIFFAVCLTAVVGVVAALIAPLIPMIYNTSDECARSGGEFNSGIGALYAAGLFCANQLLYAAIGRQDGSYLFI